MMFEMFTVGIDREMKLTFERTYVSFEVFFSIANI